MDNKTKIFQCCIFIAICLFCIFFTSCDRSSNDKSFKMEEVEQPNISWILRRENGIDANFIYGDEKYAVVSENWFISEILPGFNVFLVNNGINGYTKLKNDCDDFARAFTFYCRVKFRSLGYTDFSPAVGDFYYKWSTGDNRNTLLDGAHAICIGVFLDESGNKVVRFIEPQKANKLHTVDSIDEEIRKYYVEHIGM